MLSEDRVLDVVLPAAHRLLSEHINLLDQDIKVVVHPALRRQWANTRMDGREFVRLPMYLGPYEIVTDNSLRTNSPELQVRIKL